MADKKISALTGATTPLVGTEVLPIVQGGNTVKVSVDNLTAGKSLSAANFAPSSSTIPANGFYLPTTNAIAFSTNSTERARFNSVGNFLVNTTTTIGAGNFSLAYDGSSYNGIGINDTSGTASTAFVYFNASGTNIGTISRAGATNAVTYNTVSDRRLKSNIATLTTEQSSSIIDALLPRTFTWIADGSQAIGFITDEFQNQLPNAVTGKPNAVDSEGNPIYQMGDFSTPELIAVLVAEIQSLKARLKLANIA